MAGIFNASTGGWGNVWTDQDRNLDGDWTDRPDLVGDPLAVDRSTRDAMITHWFNPDAFQANPVGQPGSLGRNVIAQPNRWTLNFSILRDFPISEKYGRFQFRSEFFNIFNNVNLGGPCNALGCGADLGRLTNADSPRLVQFGLKYLW
jgi:hypothetical protein